MIRLRPSGADEVLIKRVRDWYEPGPGVFFTGVTGTASFTPAALFTTGVNGTWHDPSDYTTLYQDAAGTTPVTAVEQPVGLMLDKRDTAYSTYFDGSGDYLTAPYSTTSFDWWTSDFTLEAWVYATALTGWSTSIGSIDRPTLIGNSTPTSAINYWSFGPIVDGRLTFVYYNGSPVAINSASTVPTNQWSHVAMTKDSNGIRLWVNGVGTTATAISGTPQSSSGTPLSIGALNSAYINGNISNLRIVKGTALYTANFTPPTSPLTAVTGTSLLTCGTTWSGNPAITTVGNTCADKLNPFKIGTGNHAYNPSGNSANFPVLSARYNLLTKTEAFNDTGAWTKPASVTVNADAATAPNGTLTADQLVTVATQDNYIAQTVAGVNATGRTWSFSFYAKCDSGTKTVPVFIDDGNGVFAVNPATTTVNVTTSWQRFTVSGTQTSTSQTAVRVGIGGFGSWRAGDSIYIWGADLRVSNDALNQPAYQRVNTATDYDTAGFKPYLRFNGTNQWLQTNSIDFSYGDKMFVSAGVRKLSEGNTSYTAVIAEFSAVVAANSGSFLLTGRNTVDNAYYEFVSRGTTLKFSADSNSANSAPITSVISGIGDINGAPTDKVILRVNGAQSAVNTEDQGAVNYGNYPLYIGARAGSNYWFNGRLYGLVVAGKQASDSEIGQTEAFTNQKTGAY